MNHRDSVETQPKVAKGPFVCSYAGCGKVFKTKFSYKRHTLTHSQEKKYVCKYCNKKFTLSQHLKEHVYRHTDDKPNICGITGCQQRFRHASELSLHRRTHAGYKLRKYSNISVLKRSSVSGTANTPATEAKNNEEHRTKALFEIKRRLPKSKEPEKIMFAPKCVVAPENTVMSPATKET